MKALIVLAALVCTGTSCSGPTTSTDMVFDAATEGPATFAQVQDDDIRCVLRFERLPRRQRLAEPVRGPSI